ncbi:MAG: tRNA pseudouridine(55) synthase, partial [Desulfovibrio sp.]|nr:tRNA pseudouridine(55) synthase [Desulfovibrio sp.]
EYSHPFGIDAAHALDDVLRDPEGFPARVAGIDRALPAWPRLSLGREHADKVRNGARLEYTSVAISGALPGVAFTPGMRVLMLDENGKALALAEAAFADGNAVWAVTRGLWNP